MKMMRFLMTIFAFFIGTGIALAVPITTLYNTGVNNDGTVRTHGQAELHYEVVSATGSHTTGTPNVRTSAGGFPVGPWIGDNSTSAWIDAVPASGFGISTYRTTFDLTGFDVASASITGLWAGDDRGLDILINGTSTGQVTADAFFSFTSLSVTSGFVAGLNTLDFVVLNTGGPGGLRTELTGTANATVPEPSTIILLGFGLIGLVGFNYKRNKQTT